jgi:hypothetical protein
MRALDVELAGADDAHMRGILPGQAKRVGPGEQGTVSRGEGRLAPRPIDPELRDSEGEPA